MTATHDHYDAAWMVRELRADCVTVERVSTKLIACPEDTDEALRARRCLDSVLRPSDGDRIPGGVYTQAAETFAADGRTDIAEALRAIAATAPELAEAEERWKNRYAGWPLKEKIGFVLEMVTTRQVEWTGDVLSGVDGALYVKAEFFPWTGAQPIPAVTITTDVPTTEMVLFHDQLVREDWLSDRLQSQAGVRLTSCANGPECRTVLEERVLAWMLQLQSGEAEPWPELSESTFTTDARAEILLAWRDLAARTDQRSDWRVEAELASRLLRAPAWANPSIGPYGAAASLYLYRLARTFVTRRKAESAAAQLIAQDKVLLARPVQTVQLPPPRLSPEDWLGEGTAS